MDAPVLLLGLDAFKRDDRDTLDKARTMLDHMISSELMLRQGNCTQSSVNAKAAQEDAKLLGSLAEASGLSSEMLRFAELRKVLAAGNRSRNDNDCAVTQWRAIERIYPHARPWHDAANRFYIDWRTALQARLGRDFDTGLLSANRQVQASGAAFGGGEEP